MAVSGRLDAGAVCFFSGCVMVAPYIASSDVADSFSNAPVTLSLGNYGAHSDAVWPWMSATKAFFIPLPLLINN